MSQLFEKVLRSVPAETRSFLDKSTDVSDHVHEILEQKGISQREFAKMLGKGESEISKWLSGSHNLTIKSIERMEAVLNEKLLVIPQKELKVLVSR
jgi:transcriptional regulator with XRE-family HTH domain